VGKHREVELVLWPSALALAPYPLHAAFCDAENINRRSDIISVLFDFQLDEVFNASGGLSSREKIHTPFLPGEVRNCVGLPNCQMSARVTRCSTDLYLAGSNGIDSSIRPPIMKINADD
jgi:hypothetical protein